MAVVSSTGPQLANSPKPATQLGSTISLHRSCQHAHLAILGSNQPCYTTPQCPNIHKTWSNAWSLQQFSMHLYNQPKKIEFEQNSFSTHPSLTFTLSWARGTGVMGEGRKGIGSLMSTHTTSLMTSSYESC